MRRRTKLLGVSVLLLLGCPGCDPTSGKHDFKPKVFFKDRDVIALTEAAQAGDLEEVDRLVANGVDVNTQGKRGVTPLMLTMMAKGKPGFKRLLEHGADPEIQEEKGRSTIHFAASDADESYWLSEILDHGGDPNLVNPKNKQATTPLFCAIYARNIENVQALIDANADLNMANLYIEPALYHAGGLGAWDIFYLLMKHGANPNEKIPNRDSTIAKWLLESPRISIREDKYQDLWYERVMSRLKKDAETDSESDAHPDENPVD